MPSCGEFIRVSISSGVTLDKNNDLSFLCLRKSEGPFRVLRISLITFCVTFTTNLLTLFGLGRGQNGSLEGFAEYLKNGLADLLKLYDFKDNYIGHLLKLKTQG